MRLFGRKKKEDQPSLENGLIRFLDNADTEYMKSYATRSIRGLRKFMSPECVAKVAAWIYGPSCPYFGSDKFRTTTWTEIGTEEGALLIRKDVHFGKIRIAGDIRMSVADDYSELWLVEPDGTIPLVTDVRGV